MNLYIFQHDYSSGICAVMAQNIDQALKKMAEKFTSFDEDQWSFTTLREGEIFHQE